MTGLAWTAVGGEILFVEATDMVGSGQVTLIGQLGDGMKESAKISLSLSKFGSITNKFCCAYYRYFEFSHRNNIIFT